jgi:hypothetical protein
VHGDHDQRVMLITLRIRLPLAYVCPATQRRHSIDTQLSQRR